MSPIPPSRGMDLVTSWFTEYWLSSGNHKAWPFLKAVEINRCYHQPVVTLLQRWAIFIAIYRYRQISTISAIILCTCCVWVKISPADIIAVAYRQVIWPRWTLWCCCLLSYAMPRIATFGSCIQRAAVQHSEASEKRENKYLKMSIAYNLEVRG